LIEQLGLQRDGNLRFRHDALRGMMYHHTTRESKVKGCTIRFVVTAPISPRRPAPHGTNYRTSTPGNAPHRAHAKGATTTQPTDAERLPRCGESTPDLSRGGL
jgi:hypothetical protein